MARRLGLAEKDLERIGYSGLLHDIGKLGIDDRVLQKAGPLTPSERAMMMQHPVIGAEVLEKAGVLSDLIPGVRWHHEWVAGGGYPDGLKGDELPLDARIIAVADAFDAMTTARPYRPALSVAEALRRVQAGSGTQFDPRVAQALTEALEAGEIAVEQQPAAGPEPVVEAETGTIRPVHGKELSIFYRLSKEDHAFFDLDAVLQRYLEACHDIVGPNAYFVYLFGRDGELQVKGTVGAPAPACVPSGAEGLIREAMTRRSSLTHDDLEQQEGYSPASQGARSLAVVPLRSQDEALGALVVESAMPAFFSKDDLYLLEAVGQRMATSVSLVRYHERLTFAASHDGLTGVYNHGFFYDRLSMEISRAVRDGHSVSVVLADVNGLKAVNDTHGHLIGDAVLKEFARSLEQAVGERGIVARYGGDEFALILPGTTRERAAAQVSGFLRASRWSLKRGEIQIQLPSAAWGIASFPADASRASELVVQADRRMYLDKQQRKSRDWQEPVAAGD